MDELHENEQYFFTDDTIADLVRFVVRYERICVLCAPLLGRALAQDGRTVRILDIDNRFAGVDGFRYWDIQRPQRLDDTFDIIVSDPPFFNVSLSRLFRAIRMLAHGRFEQPLLIAYLRRRSAAVLGAFTRFALAPTAYTPSYVSVQRTERNEVELFGNSGEEAHRTLGSVSRPSQ